MLSALISLIAFNSFAQIYWPSLRIGVPIQDYLLHDQVSAHYSFDSAKIYLTNLTFAVFPAMASASAFPLIPLKRRRLSAYLVALGFIVNFVVIFYQTHINLSWLAAGSGTALSAQRAPGLLEDSGASTVFCSALVVGLFFVAVFGRWLPRVRFVWFVTFVIALVMGSGTGGRIYFVAVAGGVGIGVLLEIFRFLFTDRRLRTLLTGFVISAVVVFLLYWLSPHDRLATLVAAVPHSTDGFFPWLNQRLLSIDPVRALHMKTMLKAFIDHPWIGTGLGTFYSNYQGNLAWALQTGGVVFADPPASFYLMLLSELGIVGILLISSFFVIMMGSCHRILVISDIQSRPAILRHEWRCFATGCLIGISVSFFIGTHLLFLSISSILGVIIFGLCIKDDGALLPSRHISSAIWICVALLFITNSYLIYAAPRAPAFRWADRGKPQVPVSLIVPIDPHGRRGVWLSSGGELVYELRPIEVFLEMPPESYPLKLELELISGDGQVLETIVHEIGSYDKAKPWQIHTFDFNQKNSCPQIPTAANFCSYRLRTHPVWRWQGQSVGAFVIGVS